MIIIKQELSQMREQMAGRGALRSTGAQNLEKEIYFKYAIALVEEVIELIGTQTQDLSFHEKQVFWDFAALEIKQHLRMYHQCDQKLINYYIDNSITIKKYFR